MQSGFTNWFYKVDLEIIGLTKSYYTMIIKSGFILCLYKLDLCRACTKWFYIVLIKMVLYCAYTSCFYNVLTQNRFISCLYNVILYYAYSIWFYIVLMQSCIMKQFYKVDLEIISVTKWFYIVLIQSGFISCLCKVVLQRGFRNWIKK